MLPNPQKTADLVSFTEEILNGEPHFFCNVKTAEEQRQFEKAECYWCKEK